MSKESIAREWFGMVRNAAEITIEKCLEELPPRLAQKVEVSILLRQLLFDGLGSQLMRVERFDRETTGEVLKLIYSDLMEDAVAGVWSEEENMDITMFLYECTEGVKESTKYRELLEQALGTEVTDERAETIRSAAEQEMQQFAEKRNRELTPPKRRDDEPPPWLDEFEYIDWQITH